MTDPLPPHDHAGRRARAQAAVAGAQMEALFVTTPVNVRWLSGFRGSNGSILLTPDTIVFVTDARYEDRVHAMDDQLDLLVTSEPVGDVTTWLADHAVTSLGLEADDVSWSTAEQWQSVASPASLEVTATSGVIEDLRALKDDAEIARLRAACGITTDVLADVIEGLRVGMTERDVAERLASGFVDGGAEAAAFDSIIASGPNGAIPHHEAGDRTIASGDLVTLDCGARVDGYHADCTRTVAVGEPGEDWRRIHALVAAAQEAGRMAAGPGRTGKQLDETTRAVITSGGHGDHFVHGTGHGVGLEIHEAPAIGQRATSTLAAGMTITVEPGIYLPGSGGVRIEDTLLVTDDGSQVLTDLPHDLQVV